MSRDTINLLGLATSKLLRAAVTWLERQADYIATSAGAPAVLHDSIKKWFDLNWTCPSQKAGDVGQRKLQSC